MPQKALALILLPLIILLSLNCGIIALPLEAPKIVATNAQSLKFDVSIVDDAGNPLDGVTAKAVRYSLKIDPIFIEMGDSKSDPPRLVDKTLSYDTFGKYAMIVEYSKPGFSNRRIAYSREDQIYIRTPGLIVPPTRFDESINIKKRPHSTVTLTPVPATEPAIYHEPLN